MFVLGRSFASSALRWRAATIAGLTGCMALVAGSSATLAESLEGLGSLASSMTPGQWLEIPNSSVHSVLVGSDAARVIDSPTGAAFDGRRMYFHGGAPTYSGNEVYAFDLATLAWERLTEPSPLGVATESDPCPYPVDGTPKSSRTYDGVAWSPLTRTVFRFMGHDWCGRSRVPTYDNWEFDPVVRTWSQHDDPPHNSPIARTATDPATGHIIYGDNSNFYDFDPITGSYSRKSPDHRLRGPGSLAIDSLRRVAVALDRAGIYSFEIDGARLGITTQLKLTGDLPPTDARGRISINGWGLTYDSNRGRFVLWGGDRDIYTLDGETGLMTRYVNQIGAAPGASTSRSAGRGRIYSKWIYVADYDVFVGYGNADEGVWLYRLPDAPQEPLPPGPIADDTPPQNGAPKANAGRNQTAAAGDLVELSGRASSDPEGDPLSYDWALVTVPTGSTAKLFALDTVDTSFVADVAGTYVAELIVSDGVNDSGTDSVTITVAAPAPAPGPAPSPSPTGESPRAPSLGAIVSEMKPGEWMEIPGTAVRPVLVTEDEAPPNTWGHQGSISVVTAWTGAAFDGRRMYLHGGGHNSYGGNEVYAFDFESLTWERLTEPSPLAPRTLDGGCPPMPADGTPMASHTYDGIFWSQLTKTIFRLQGGLFCSGGGPTRQVWEFDPANKKWTRHDDSITGGGAVRSTLDPITGRFIVGGGEGIGEFDPVTRSFVRFTATGAFSGEGNFALDPENRVVVSLDGGGVEMFPADVGSVDRPTSIALNGDSLPTDGQGKLFVRQMGIQFSPAQHKFVLWRGEREVYTLDALSGTVTRFPNPNGPAPSVGESGSTNRVFSKWFYLAEHDVFAGYSNVNEGVWLYKLPAEPQSEPETPGPGPSAGAILVCGPGQARSECLAFDHLQDAVNAAAPGSDVILSAGEYPECAVITTDGIAIRGEPGAHLRGKACEAKAAIVVRADNVVIEGIECSEILVSDGNGACIRIEGPNLTVRNVYFHDNQEGILGGMDGGTVVVESSRFERNGKGGSAHSVYISHRVDTLIFRNNEVYSTKGEGHGLKSRARTSVIEHNIIAGLEGVDSRAIDVPNGGDVTIRNNVLEKGPNSQNSQMIGIALEGNKLKPNGEPHGFHDVNTTLIEGNVIVFDRTSTTSNKVFKDDSPGPITLTNNVMIGDFEIGGEFIDGGGNLLLNTREAAGIGPFPALPDLP